uniref:Universal stress protein n=1 Tax=Roseihalotalea indica TaxID=2867963 RepID=A0AA49JH52_9BACT|nr:universal stress protein [Tunicatimonas sp. TK19036]
MYHLKRIVVSVNLIDLDEEVIRYASIVSQIMDADTIYFVHIAETLNLPENLDKQYRDVLAPVDETIKHEVQGTVDKYFAKEKNTACSIDILEGRPTDELIKYGKRKDADLIILGKPDEQAQKIKLGKVVELSACSVLFVPKHADIKIEKIAVALDFSEHAKMALEQALKFAEEGRNVTIYGQHIYQVPHGYSKTGKSYEEFKTIMENNAKKDAEQFFKQYHLSENLCEMRYQLSEDAKIDDELFGFAEEKDVDLLVIGSRGRTAAASILLGSVAERLLHYKNNIPLFIVKEKNSNMGFFEALFKI